MHSSYIFILTVIILSSFSSNSFLLRILKLLSGSLCGRCRLHWPRAELTVAFSAQFWLLFVSRLLINLSKYTYIHVRASWPRAELTVAHAHMHMHMHMHTCTCTCTCTHAHMHMHTCTHAHSHAKKVFSRTFLLLTAFF